MPAQEPQPGRFRRLIGLKRVLFANLVVFAIIGWGFSGEMLRNRDMQREIDRLKEEAAQLETKNAELAQLSDRASSRQVLEQQARLKLNLQKPGEQVVVVRPGPGRAEDEPVPVRPVSEDEPKSNPGRWWHYFFR